MKLETKFDLDQEVWIVHQGQVTKKHHVQCEACDSTGYVTIKDRTYECPKCYGRMESDICKLQYSIYSHGKVGKISSEHYSREYEYYTDKDEITYMIDSTGVGSGSVWKESQVFDSEKSAQDYCDTMNKELN